MGVGLPVAGAPVVGDPRWRLFTEKGYLIATAGSDEVWVVDDVAGDVVSELAACWTERPPKLDQLSGPAVLAVEQLRAVGVFGPQNSVPARPQVAVITSGDPVPGFTSTLARLCRDHGWPELLINPTESADLTVVVRSTGSLARTAELGRELLRAERIHLLCDLAAARTVAIGPFVVPGHTACLGCLAGRLGTRWGDAPAPPRPGATGTIGATTAAGLVAHHLRLAAEEDRFPLVDATISLELDSLRGEQSPCLTLPQCPSCAGLRGGTGDGRVVLPWAP